MEIKINFELDSAWKPRKKNNLRLADSYARIGKNYPYSGTDYTRKSQTVRDCGTYLEFAFATSGDYRLHHANFCRDRLCPICNWRRSRKIYGQLTSVLEFLSDGHYQYLFCTLTIRNCLGCDLGGTIQLLLDGYRRLLHNCRAMRQAILGTERNLEITYNRQADTWHPHIHAIFCVGPDYGPHGTHYITQRQLCQYWRDAIMVDYIPICDIRRIRPCTSTVPIDSVAADMVY